MGLVDKRGMGLVLPTGIWLRLWVFSVVGYWGMGGMLTLSIV